MMDMGRLLVLPEQRTLSGGSIGQGSVPTDSGADNSTAARPREHAR
jgi:hypothetical protein